MSWIREALRHCGYIHRSELSESPTAPTAEDNCNRRRAQEMEFLRQLVLRLASAAFEHSCEHPTDRQAEIKVPADEVAATDVRLGRPVEKARLGDGLRCLDCGYTRPKGATQP